MCAPGSGGYHYTDQRRMDNHGSGCLSAEDPSVAAPFADLTDTQDIFLALNFTVTRMSLEAQLPRSAAASSAVHMDSEQACGAVLTRGADAAAHSHAVADLATSYSSSEADGSEFQVGLVQGAINLRGLLPASCSGRRPAVHLQPGQAEPTLRSSPGSGGADPVTAQGALQPAATTSPAGGAVAPGAGQPAQLQARRRQLLQGRPTCTVSITGFSGIFFINTTASAPEWTAAANRLYGPLLEPTDPLGPVFFEDNPEVGFSPGAHLHLVPLPCAHLARRRTA